MEIFAIVSVAFLNFAFAGISTRIRVSNTKLARFFFNKMCLGVGTLDHFSYFFQLRHFSGTIFGNTIQSLMNKV